MGKSKKQEKVNSDSRKRKRNVICYYEGNKDDSDSECNAGNNFSEGESEDDYECYQSRPLNFITSTPKSLKNKRSKIHNTNNRGSQPKSSCISSSGSQSFEPFIGGAEDLVEQSILAADTSGINNSDSQSVEPSCNGADSPVHQSIVAADARYLTNNGYPTLGPSIDGDMAPVLTNKGRIRT